MTGSVFRFTGKGVLISGIIVAYVLTGSVPTVAASQNRLEHVNVVCEHPAPPPRCTWLKGKTCAQDHMDCSSPICEYAAPPPGCAWVTGSTCVQAHLVCTGR